MDFNYSGFPTPSYYAGGVSSVPGYYPTAYPSYSPAIAGLPGTYRGITPLGAVEPMTYSTLPMSRSIPAAALSSYSTTTPFTSYAPFTTMTTALPLAKPKLVYFDGRGRAEILRLLFALGKMDFEDVRFKPNADNATNPSRPNDELMEFKKSGNSITGQVPYLEIDGMKLSQSLAIARYLARKLGYYGLGDPSMLQIDMVMDTVEDLRVKAIQAMFEKDEAHKAALLKDYVETFIPKYGEALEKFLDRNEFKSGFFVGYSLTLADLFVYDFWTSVIQANPDAAKPFTKLAALVEKVGAIPEIAAWVAKRPKTPW